MKLTEGNVNIEMEPHEFRLLKRLLLGTSKQKLEDMGFVVYEIDVLFKMAHDCDLNEEG